MLLQAFFKVDANKKTDNLLNYKTTAWHSQTALDGHFKHSLEFGKVILEMKTGSTVCATGEVESMASEMGQQNSNSHTNTINQFFLFKSIASYNKGS